MSYYSSNAARSNSFYRLPETCHDVRVKINEAIRSALDENLDYLKDDISLDSLTGALTDAAFAAAVEYGSNKLREALIECEQEKLEAEDRAEEAEKDVEDYKSTIKQLELEIEQLRDELDSTIL